MKRANVRGVAKHFPGSKVNNQSISLHDPDTRDNQNIGGSLAVEANPEERKRVFDYYPSNARSSFVQVCL